MNVESMSITIVKHYKQLNELKAKNVAKEKKVKKKII